MPAFIVARWEYLTRLRSKAFILSTLLMPLLIIAMSFLPTLLIQKTESDGLALAIVDLDGAWERDIGSVLDERHTDAAGRTLYPRYYLNATDFSQKRTQAIELLNNGAIDAVLVIGDGFLEAGTVSYIGGKRSGFIEQEQVRSAVRRARRIAIYEQGQISIHTRNLIEHDISWNSYADGDADRAVVDEVQIFLKPIIYTLILFMAIFLSAQIIMRGIIEERGNRVIEILLSSISSKDLMTGKILGIGLIGLTQLAIYLTVAMLTQLYFREAGWQWEGLVWFLIFGIPGYFLYAAIFAAFGSLFESDQEAQQFVGVFNIIPVLPLLFSTLIIMQPESLAVRVASFVPPITPFIMIMRLTVSDVAPWEIVAPLLLLIISAYLAMRWAGIVFRTAILLYGKRATLPEIMRWVRSG
ncbi:MAG: ABC transporter permease [Candidatus Marinimicrobia bacterium]|nr:ABC transporter permease [Candidatus Neomarinimicrobiota bacterium]